MNYTYTGKKVRSSGMSAEEIRRERQQSGWNPYAGEEETVMSSGSQESQMMPESCFCQMNNEQVMEEQMGMERDLRSLQSMYPQAAKKLLPYIEEECDRMEYEGSSMYAQYPDQTTVQNIQNRIYRMVKDQFEVDEPDQPEDIVSLQYRRPERDPRGKNWLDQLIRVMLLQEMYYRRCRRRGCRKWL